MKYSILKKFTLVIIIAVIIAGVICSIIFDIKLTDDKKQELQRMVDVMAGEFDENANDNEQAIRFGQAANGIRVTIIEEDGTVTGDSEVNYRIMENHADREEILQARGTDSAVTIRKSETIGKKLIYAVRKTSNGYYIRLSEEYNGILADMISFLPAILLSALSAFIIAMYLAGRFSNGIAGPIETMNDSLMDVVEGNTKLDPEKYPYDELKGMAGMINQMSEEVSRHIDEIKEEKDKIEYILDHMREGFIMMDSNARLLLINSSACKYMKCNKNVIGKDLYHLTRNLNFITAAYDTIEKHKSERIDMDIDGAIIEVSYNLVENGQGEMEHALIIVMTDVTEKRNSEQMRREFFSNASHELKTPITSIKGSAELLCSDIPLSDEQKQEMLTRIGLESDRMCTLIGDILMINRLESSVVNKDVQYINLEDAVNDYINEVRVLAEQNKITVTADTEKAIIYANERDVRELIGNLIINAIKYNKENGKVDVTLKSDKEEIIFTVRNDGDIIPVSQQARVFERFYRIDKGRSRTVGGTGLGLAIAKHVVDSMGGRITLESNEEIGTKFIVRIPAKNEKE